MSQDTNTSSAYQTSLGRILEDSLNEIFLFDAQSLRFLQVNHGARENLGYSMEQLRHLTPVDIKPAFTAEQFIELIEPLQSGSEDKLVFETVHARKDGSQYNVEVHLQMGTFQGATCFVAIILDITERREAEAALRRSEERLSLAFRATRDAIWDADLVAGTVWRNEAYDKLYGERPLETQDTWRWWIEHIHPDDRARVANSSKIAAASGPDYGNYWEEDYRFRRKNGRYAHVMDRAFIARNADGQPTRILGAMHDITVRVLAEEKRLQNERLLAIGEAMAGLVHESRNALNRMHAALRMIERRTKDQPELDQFFDGAREAQQDIQRLFEEVRQYAAPLNINPQPCNLVELVDKTWKHLRLVRKKRKAHLVQSYGDISPKCNVCPTTLSQVFRNMLENALAACQDPVEIEVRYSDAWLHGDPAICVAVCDNGPGLTAEVQAQVFDAFFSTKTHGTGLGLAISKRIVEAHGGSLGFAKDNGDGATFIITLPLTR